MFIPFLGEKSKHKNFILPNIPNDISTYAEPFGGSFAIFFSLDLSLYPKTQFIYNDINILNVNLIKQLSNPEFMNYLFSIRATKEKYNEIKFTLSNNSWNDFEKAANWLILLSCSVSKYDILNGAFKNEFEFETFKLKYYNSTNINHISKIEMIDCLDFIDKYDSKETFFYVDPPYINLESYYTNHDFLTVDHHIELSKKLKNIKGRFLLSYLKNDLLKDLYPDYNFKELKTMMGTETLIMNYSY